MLLDVSELVLHRNKLNYLLSPSISSDEFVALKKNELQGGFSSRTTAKPESPFQLMASTIHDAFPGQGFRQKKSCRHHDMQHDASILTAATANAVLYFYMVGSISVFNKEALFLIVIISYNT